MKKYFMENKNEEYLIKVLQRVRFRAKIYDLEATIFLDILKKILDEDRYEELFSLINHIRIYWDNLWDNGKYDEDMFYDYHGLADLFLSGDEKKIDEYKLNISSKIKLPSPNDPF